nr:MAG TPA: hypothetical protein [Bacteriophage sp.]
MEIARLNNRYLMCVCKIFRIKLTVFIIHLFIGFVQ